MKKSFALFPETKKEGCGHQGGFPYRGKIPCTGPQVCYLCGTRKEDADPSTHKESYKEVGRILVEFLHRTKRMKDSI